MGWIPQALASALQQAAELNVKIDYNDHSFIIIMNDYGDLRLNVLFTSRQIIIETIICPLSAIQRQDLFNAFILRHQKLLPLSSVAISRLKNDEYYVAFGALSLNSSLEDVVLEIATLAANALDLAELIEQYTNK
ncbi:TPA: DUF2170 family protein [Klebsiella pneumoniae]|jgi:uncharacterized protein YjfI (DUF2170 family)|uniref:Uncharacterized protein conserved in bacteria n=3 Tax=Klebsiella pneumoniae TaxID=573 RepID=A0A485H3Y3_KLEPN|nr:DUF2170 family protein [Klebsiella pneumoniae]CDL23704.1 FIG006163: hypothetical protein [Klebsiella pneumoniae IS53]ARA42502.1 hypothetical protein AM364_19830 [Klebsiella pneumoniae]ATR01419.1 DUF2170 domain-containing protein [Klebsiella pneumoniae]ATR06590.1 DUF2170 domain-containing protein [Klebsiella pneumoniae]ATR11989.1 DUF2170 domain-containing protein [Klebsiella pneumoniae]